MGLRLSPDKTLITHVDEGLDFLGWRIQRHRKRGTNRRYVYTCPTKKALRPAMATVQTLCRQVGTNNPLDALLLRLNPALRGWCAYFRPGVSAATFGYLGHYAWWQVGRWLRRKHARITWKELRRRHCGSGWWPAARNGNCSTPRQCTPRATNTGEQSSRPLAGLGLRTSHPLGTCGEPGAQKRARRVREAVRENGPVERPAPRPGPTSQLTP